MQGAVELAWARLVPARQGDGLARLGVAMRGAAWQGKEKAVIIRNRHRRPIR